MTLYLFISSSSGDHKSWFAQTVQVYDCCPSIIHNTVPFPSQNCVVAISSMLLLFKKRLCKHGRLLWYYRVDLASHLVRLMGLLVKCQRGRTPGENNLRYFMSLSSTRTMFSQKTEPCNVQEFFSIKWPTCCGRSEVSWEQVDNSYPLKTKIQANRSEVLLKFFISEILWCPHSLQPTINKRTPTGPKQKLKKTQVSFDSNSFVLSITLSHSEKVTN